MTHLISCTALYPLCQLYYEEGLLLLHHALEEGQAKDDTSCNSMETRHDTRDTSCNRMEASMMSKKRHMSSLHKSVH